MSVSPGGQQYVVKQGDTLSSISRQFYGRAELWPRIAAANRISNANLIFVGARLTIPGQGSSAARPAPTPVVAARHAAPSPAAAPRSPGSTVTPPAIGVAYPPVSYSFDRHFTEIEQDTPVARVVVRLTGDVVFELRRALKVPGGIDFSMKELTPQLKSEYDSAIGSACADVKQHWNSVDNTMNISFGLSTESKVGGKTFICQEARFEPPATVVYKAAARPVEGRVGDLLYKGSLACEVRITPKSNFSPALVPVRLDERVRIALPQLPENIGQVVLVAGVVVLIVAAVILAPVPTVMAGAALVTFNAAKQHMGY